DDLGAVVVGRRGRAGRRQGRPGGWGQIQREDIELSCLSGVRLVEYQLPGTLARGKGRAGTAAIVVGDRVPRVAGRRRVLEEAASGIAREPAGRGGGGTVIVRCVLAGDAQVGLDPGGAGLVRLLAV